MRRHRILLTATTSLGLVAMTFVSGAAPGSASSKIGSVTPQSSCFKTFTNPGPPPLTVCVSANGNLNDIVYSGRGTPVDQMAGEGYCLRRLEGSGTTYYDPGFGASGWGAASDSSTATTATVTRTTTDGRFTLTQDFAFKYGSRMVVVGNQVKNNDPNAAHPVLFDRSFDADMAGTSGNDVFEEDGSSVLAKEGDGLMLTSMVPSMIANLGAETFVDFVA